MKLSELIKSLNDIALKEDKNPEVDLVMEFDDTQYEDKLGNVVVSREYKEFEPTGEITIKLIGLNFKEEL